MSRAEPRAERGWIDPTPDGPHGPAALAHMGPVRPTWQRQSWLTPNCRPAGGAAAARRRPAAGKLIESDALRTARCFDAGLEVSGVNPPASAGGSQANVPLCGGASVGRTAVGAPRALAEAKRPSPYYPLSPQTRAWRRRAVRLPGSRPRPSVRWRYYQEARRWDPSPRKASRRLGSTSLSACRGLP